MKKLLLLLLVVIGIVGCDKAEGDKEKENPSLEVTVRTAEDFTQYPEKLPTRAVIEVYDITSGITINKKISDADGVAKDDSGNTINAIVKDIDKTSLYSTDLEINKKYYIFVKVVDDDYGNIYAHSDTTIVFDKKIIELEKIFSAGAKPSTYEKWNIDLTQKQSDFFVASFGDSKEYVKAKESSIPLNSDNSKLVYLQSENGKYRTEKEYHFTGNQFTKGLTNLTAIFRASSGSGEDIGVDMGTKACLANYKNSINMLKEEYGTPKFVSEDVFLLTETGESDGSIFRAGMDVMNGRKTYTYKFSNADRSVECTLQRSNRRAVVGTWGFTIEHIYNAN